MSTRKYSSELKCGWNLSLVWLFLTIVACYLNCLDTVVLAHPFWALATFPVCFSVLSCWTNRASSTPYSSIFLHICSWNWLFTSDIHCSHGTASMSVHVSTISPSSYIRCYNFFSQRKQIQASTIILLLLPIRIFQHPKYKRIYTSNIKQVEEWFQRPTPCWSHTSVFPHELVQNVSPTFSGIILHHYFRFVIFFLSHARVVILLQWKEDDSLVSCWYLWY